MKKIYLFFASIAITVMGGALFFSSDASAGPCSVGLITNLRSTSVSKNSIKWSWGATGTCGYYHIREVVAPVDPGYFGTSSKAFSQYQTGYNGTCDLDSETGSCTSYNVRRNLRPGETVCITVHQASAPLGQAANVGPESARACATTAGIVVSTIK